MASKPTTRVGRERARLETERLRKISRGWAERHPRRAQEERALRKAHKLAHASFGYANYIGTPETHFHATRVQQGALARLYRSGAISADQLAWSAEIARVHAMITGDVTVRTVSLETRVDQSGKAGGAFFEKLGRVRAEVAYGKWRARLPVPGPVLAMIVEDLGVAAAAKVFRMRAARARALLIAALDAWPDANDDAVREVDEATLLAAQAAIL